MGSLMDRVVPRNRGQFRKGMPRPKDAGRRKGTPNKHTADIRAMLRQAASDVGYKEWQDKVQKGKIVGKVKVLGKDGELGYLRYLADEHPRTFAAMYSKALIPHYITTPPDEPTENVVYHTLAEMEQAMIEDGLRLLSLLLFERPHELLVCLPVLQCPPRARITRKNRDDH
jgi:hypothetical protein